MEIEKVKRNKEDEEILNMFFVKQIIKDNKDKWFVNHIKNHLAPNESVGCTICGKDIDTIALEHIKIMIKYLSVECPNLFREKH